MSFAFPLKFLMSAKKIDLEQGDYSTVAAFWREELVGPNRFLQGIVSI